MDSNQLQIELESFPSELRPMQAASAEAPFSSPEYIFEVKWDGLRCMLFRDPEGKVHIQDRGLNDLTADLPEVTAAASRVPNGSVIDGELVATDSDGRPDYTRLRERLAAGAARKDEIPVAYLAFDALIVGFYEDGRLLPCGSVGGGYDQGMVQAIKARLVELATDSSPLDPPPIMTKPVRWVRPELVVSVRYSEWSPDGTLRFPIFNGLRPEVHPAEAVRHRPRVVISGHVKPGSLAYDLTRFPF